MGELGGAMFVLVMACVFEAFAQDRGVLSQANGSS